MKHSCCVLLQAIRCYRLPLEKLRLQTKKRIKPNLALNKERKECGCVFFYFIFFSSCRSELMQHAFRPKNFTPVASSSLWDLSLSPPLALGLGSVCVCVCASTSECVFMCSSSPPWPRILHSAQLRMRAQAPHCALFSGKTHRNRF